MTAHPAVRLLVCGDRNARDAGLALWATGLLLPRLRDQGRRRVEATRCEQLDVKPLLEVDRRAQLLILDAAAGVPPGEIVTRSLDELIDDPSGPTPRSAGVPIDQILGVANVLADAPLRGCFIGMGGASFEAGSTLSPAVRSCLPDYVAAILDVVERLDQAGLLSDPCTSARGHRR
ncbi:MAG TPA: hypothetical protein VNT28_08145 [Candidatus Limnocylindrales bacterium]|jgi:hydrogenase maturation protease|nr:hypothetical protein [Candidatus Limnocylindrales bacterium]